jgi:hypothetical protein
VELHFKRVNPAPSSGSFLPIGSPFSIFQNLFLNLGRISKIDAVGKTDIVSTGWIEPLIHPVEAEVTLLSCPLGSVKGDGSERACINTHLTSRASFSVQDDDSILPLDNGLFRARPHAWGGITVLADIKTINEIKLSIDAFGSVFGNIDIIDPVRLMMFLFAGHFTRLTSPTGVLVDVECHFLHGRSPSFFSG